jgi:single-strand DNA-binding protein
MHHVTVQASGVVTSQFHLRYSQAGKPWGHFAIAVIRNFKGREVKFFLDCKAFGDDAERFAQAVVEGAEVDIDGHLDQESWKDKKTDEWRRKFALICKDVRVTKAPQEAPPGMRTVAEVAKDEEPPF